jgi:hypothetical protein
MRAHGACRDVRERENEDEDSGHSKLARGD